MPAPSPELKAKVGLAEQDLWAELPAKADGLLGEDSLIRADYTSKFSSSPSSCSSASSSSGDFEGWSSSTLFHKSTAADSTIKAWSPGVADSKAGHKPSPPVPWWFSLRSPIRFRPWTQPSGRDLTALLEYNEGKKYRCPCSCHPGASACPLRISEQIALNHSVFKPGTV